MEKRLGKDEARRQTKVIHKTQQALGGKVPWGFSLGRLLGPWRGAESLPRAPRGRWAQNKA